MNAKVIVVFALVMCCASCGWARLQPKFYASKSNMAFVNVMNFGANGDGKTYDTQAFLKAWEKACGMSKPVTLLVPAKKSFLLNPITFEGPCKSNNINVEIWGKILAPSKGSGWKSSNDQWIVFESIDGLTLKGNGQIDGQGSSWWKCKDNGKCSSAPNAVQINQCKNIQVNSLQILRSPQKHLVFHKSMGIKISNIKIISPGDSPNTDGIYFRESSQIEVTNSNIGTGDDCISLGPGTANVNISKVFCGPGHGISIGSLGNDSEDEMVEQIHVWNCTFIQTMNGARIKTWQGGSGQARGISFDDIIIQSVDNPIVIDQYYCNGAHHCANQTSAVKISDVSFINIRGTSTKETAIKLACSKTVPCTDIRLEDINLSLDSKDRPVSYCLSVKGTSQHVNPLVPCLG